MGKVVADISMSLDGFVAGPNQRLDAPLGDGGMRLHEWVFRLAPWRERHGEQGGEGGQDADVVAESIANLGAVVMGRNMFGGGDGPWGDEPWEGWWGDEPPYHAPVFVLTHHAREPLRKDGGTDFTFVTDGVESALEQAHAAAGGKDVMIAGGASAVQQYIAAGLLDEIQIHVAPILLGSGERLLDGLDTGIEFEPIRVIDSPTVTHLKYRMVK
jgi:dihydrofolate reductase